MADNQQSLANLPVIYSNNIRLALSFADFRLIIGEALPVGPIHPPGTPLAPSSTPPEQVDRLCIVLSPDIVPQLISGLETAVVAYERTFGPLRKIPNIPQVTVATPK
jgi:hypothetical protein